MSGLQQGWWTWNTMGGGTPTDPIDRLHRAPKNFLKGFLLGLSYINCPTVKNNAKAAQKRGTVTLFCQGQGGPKGMWGYFQSTPQYWFEIRQREKQSWDQAHTAHRLRPFLTILFTPSNRLFEHQFKSLFFPCPFVAEPLPNRCRPYKKHQKIIAKIKPLSKHEINLK